MGTFSSYQPHYPCSSTSRLRASMSIPDQTHFEDHDTVRLFCSNALKISAEKGYLPEGKQLHARLIKFGFCHVLSLQNQILSVYLKCKETEDAEKLFDGLPVRNVVSWNIMIRGIVGSCDNENELDRKQLCFSYFKRMLLEMVVPDYITLNGLICSCARFYDAEMGIQLHCFTVKVGFDLDCFVGCALVDLYAKFGFVENARRVFCVAPFRDLVMWNVMISCYTFNCLPEEAFSSMLSVLSDDALGYYDFGKQIHSLVLRQSFDSDVLVASALINMYAKNKNIIDARRVFDEMSIRNVVAWNTMVVGCGNHGDGNEVMRLLREMLREGFLPDELTISSVISSCGYASAITETLQAHAFAVKLSCHDFLSVANSLINAYSKCGSIASAFKCFELTSQPDLVTWTSLICAYAFHGLAKEATEMFEKMLSRGIIPDKIAFLGVLTACAHRGLVTKGLHISECCHKFISKWPWQKKLVEISKVAYHSHQPARKYKSTQVSLQPCSLLGTALK
ncbi:pentatricopeptide repeat-containing protein At2g46050, mitochondrial-like [Lathyrus oleraceus]|uniref:pentatricopeptide repeat-containing protein At2g46050, mitochondrial-like n=1 Tax=Pisum sativum TaxID=3888 RepID=UPI0021D1F462|nr:pentatricopeptide repeat-containing protein At2g46050, mitochondrial-like [Pisum sativum]